MKALAAGADAVMIGSLLAGTAETPGKIIDLPEQGKVKVYRGSASHSAQKDRGKTNTSVEGAATLKPFKGDLKNIFREIVNGILSGMSYQGAKSITELQRTAEFILQTSAGHREATPYGT
jgi:IMP dehydrogenase